MKRIEMQKLIDSGVPVAVAEYRSTNAETIKWRDKVSGRQMEAPIVKHYVEMGGKQVGVAERVPDTTDVSKVQAPFKKGTMVIIILKGLEQSRGALSAEGTLVEYEDFAAPSRVPA